MRMTRTSDSDNNDNDNNNNSKDAGQVHGTRTRDENDEGQG